MVLGEGGRILKEVRERATQILVSNIQRPVSMTVQVVKRKNSISA
jgi:GTPase Era involved in 16S rRNA processing